MDSTFLIKVHILVATHGPNITREINIISLEILNNIKYDNNKLPRVHVSDDFYDCPKHPNKYAFRDLSPTQQ